MSTYVLYLHSRYADRYKGLFETKEWSNKEDPEEDPPELRAQGHRDGADDFAVEVVLDNDWPGGSSVTKIHVLCSSGRHGSKLKSKATQATPFRYQQSMLLRCLISETLDPLANPPFKIGPFPVYSHPKTFGFPRSVKYEIAIAAEIKDGSDGTPYEFSYDPEMDVDSGSGIMRRPKSKRKRRRKTPPKKKSLPRKKASKKKK